MIDVSELTGKVRELIEDLEQQVGRDDEVASQLERAWEQATAKGRTGANVVEWREEYLTQVAVGWVLSCLFVRYLEDNKLIDAVLVGQTAQDRQRAYFQSHREQSDTDYLLHLFDNLSPEDHPAGELFGPARNPLHKLRVSGDAARGLIAFFRRVDPDSGELRFAFDNTDTRFLGDVYQDLSEDVRKKYALLQTPDFVEEYILDYTLEPAIDTFGLDQVRFIDPTCGSGHFLLGGFRRLVEKKQRARPSERVDVLVREALEATCGVDINPFAVAIARFRLAVEAMLLCGYDSFTEMPALPLNVACGDSLLLGQLFDRFERDTSKNKRQLDLDKHRWSDALSTEDNDLIFGTPSKPGILTQQYHAVVGNPPYITVKDASVRDSYREYYASCHGKYALVCPFYERFFDLAIGDESKQSEQMMLGGVTASSQDQPAGYVGMIVANSFMKRSFGKKLITKLVPHTDLTHVIDTSGAYIPGHGTPTVILVGRNRAPQNETLRAVLGIRGEPKTPSIPRNGKVWRSIADHTDDDGFENDFVSVSDTSRDLFHQHPWSLQGGGALECKTLLESNTTKNVDLCSDKVGITAVTGEDDIYIMSNRSHKHRVGLPTYLLCLGDMVRDWSIESPVLVAWTYNNKFEVIEDDESIPLMRHLWRSKNRLNRRKRFGTPMKDKGLSWYEWQELYSDKLKQKLTITFAFVATHNHFVLDRGGKVFKQSAPVIKLPEDATERDHLSLMAALNSSTACFYMKQVFFGKHMGDGGPAHADPAYQRFEFDCTKMKGVPIPEDRPTELAVRLDELAQELSSLEPGALAEDEAPTVEVLDDARARQREIFMQMVALQEELDWRCYASYGLLEEDAPVVPYDKLDDLPGVALGERAFEVRMSRKIDAGDLETSWFTRHGSDATSEIPAHFPEWYRELLKRRLELMEERQFIRLIEQPEYKRRWNRTSWEEREKVALRAWLCDRLEAPAYVPQADREDDFARTNPRVITVQSLADVAGRDQDFVAVGERFTGDASFDVFKLVEALVMEESVPALPTQRYKKAGLKRRREWESVWEQQRMEDAIQARCDLPEDHEDYLTEAQARALVAREVGDIPKPPKYSQSHFLSGPTWSHRGKLDVPKERFVWLKGCHTEEGQQVVMWAGLDHGQRAMALLSYYSEEALVAGWTEERKALLLAGMLDLLPWVKQWHNALDPRMNARFGDFLETFIEGQARDLAMGLDAIEVLRIGA